MRRKVHVRLLHLLWAGAVDQGPWVLMAGPWGAYADLRGSDWEPRGTNGHATVGINADVGANADVGIGIPKRIEKTPE